MQGCNLCDVTDVAIVLYVHPPGAHRHDVASQATSKSLSSGRHVCMFHGYINRHCRRATRARVAPASRQCIMESFSLSLNVFAVRQLRHALFPFKHVSGPYRRCSQGILS